MGTGRSGLKKGGGPKGIKKFKTETINTSFGSSYLYAGDAQDAIDFFRKNSNFEELISQMDDNDKKAFIQWSDGIFMGGEQYNGWDNMPELAKALTQIYDKYLDQATLDQGVEVSRISTAQLIFGAGKTTATLEEFRAMEGNIVTSKGSMSTGAASQGLKISEGDVEYKITIPPGSKGAGMWIGDGRVNDLEATQREFMMNRDSAYRVGKTVYNRKRKKYIVNVEWVGLTEHDYGTSGKLSNDAVKKAFEGTMYF